MNQKILIVDDEPSLRNALVDKFTRAGFTVLIAENGQSGLALALAERPNLILLDILMPVMDGLTMLAELRQDDWGKSVPVILLTNLSDSVSNAKFPTQKETSYIMKSNWKIEDIVKQVTKILTK